MMYYIMIAVSFILLSIIIIIISAKITNFNDLKRKIERSKNNISNVLNKKIDLMNKAQKVLESEFKIEAFNINIGNLDNDYDIELDKNVELIESRLISEVNKSDEIKNNKKIIEIKKDIKEINNDILGLKEYYNLYVSDFNKLFNNKLYHLLFKIRKLKKMESFDIKNHSDLQILKN